MKNWFVVLLFFTTVCTWSQTSNEKILHGKIVADSASVAGIDVVNLGNEKVTVTNNKGEFSILAKADDILVFSSMTLEMKRMLVDEDDLKSETITIYMTPKINELNEVIVKKNLGINALSMGIVQKKPKHYTPAERKLKTAGDFKPIHLLGILGGSLPVDPIINAINGRTKKLKNQIKIENKEFLLLKISELYKFDFFIKTLKISSENVKGFQYYLVENNSFIETLKLNKTEKTTFLIIELAVKYNEMIACE